MISKMCLSIGEKRLYISGHCQDGIKIFDLESKKIIANKTLFANWKEDMFTDGFVTDFKGKLALSTRTKLLIIKEERFSILKEFSPNDTVGMFQPNSRRLFYSPQREYLVWWSGKDSISIICMKSLKIIRTFKKLFEHGNEILVNSSLCHNGEKITAITTGEEFKKVYLIDLIEDVPPQQFILSSNTRTYIFV